MPHALILIQRSLSFPKAVWRAPTTRRTFAPLALPPLVSAALRAWEANFVERGIVEGEADGDGSLLHPPSARTAQERDYAGVFDLAFSQDGVKVRLSQEACVRALRSPRRRSAHLATLRAGEGLRIVLNGKADWPSGRFYYLRDYHLVFCDGLTGSDCPVLRTMDLQANLR